MTKRRKMICENGWDCLGDTKLQMPIQPLPRGQTKHKKHLRNEQYRSVIGHQCAIQSKEEWNPME